MRLLISTTLALFAITAVHQTAVPPSPSSQPAVADHLSPEEVKAAVSAKPGSGFVEMDDMGFTTASACTAQMPSESIFTPTGWLNALSIVAKRQFLPFTPNDSDTLRALTVISEGCASGTPAGPVCDSITRVALVSDANGTAIAEAISSSSRASTFQNGFGATAACSSLVSKFALADVARVRNAKGEFMIVTFSGATPLKRYTVKQKHIKSLGL